MRWILRHDIVPGLTRSKEKEKFIKAKRGRRKNKSRILATAENLSDSPAHIFRPLFLFFLFLGIHRRFSVHVIFLILEKFSGGNNLVFLFVKTISDASRLTKITISMSGA